MPLKKRRREPSPVEERGGPGSPRITKELAEDVESHKRRQLSSSTTRTQTPAAKRTKVTDKYPESSPSEDSEHEAEAEKTASSPQSSNSAEEEHKSSVSDRSSQSENSDQAAFSHHGESRDEDDFDMDIPDPREKMDEDSPGNEPEPNTDPYHRIMNAMTEIIRDLDSKPMMVRRFQTSLNRRAYKIRQRQDYPEKSQDLNTVERSRQAVENMKAAATLYHDFCEGMIGSTIRTVAQANRTIEELKATKQAFENAQTDFISTAKEMIDVNERFCSFKNTPRKHRMHKKPEWKALRREVMRY